MTNAQIYTSIKRIQKKVNQLAKMDIEGEVTINENLKVTNLEMAKACDEICNAITSPEGFKKIENQIYTKTLTITLFFRNEK